jgi:hypothetical protein
LSEGGSCKLRDLLPANIRGLGTTLRTELDKEHPEEGAALAWDFIASSATEKIGQALDADVFELFARGWSLSRELTEYADPALHPDGERAIVQLGSHELTTSVHPVLSFRVGELALRPLRFTVTLAAHIEPLELEIENGRIQAIGSGECSVSAQLKYGSVELHEPMEARHLKLPARYELAPPGVAIG